MPHRSLSRLLAASLSVAAVAAPSALAQPAADWPSQVAKPPALSQDQRSPDAKDAATVNARGTDVSAPDQQDRRDAAGIQKSPHAGTTEPRTRQAGPPTWPARPTPIAAGQSAPTDGNGDGPMPVILLIIAAVGIAMLAGMRFVRPRTRAARARV
jgi:hypothetical protein